MAGVTPKDVDVFTTHDSFGVHLPPAAGGFGHRELQDAEVASTSTTSPASARV